MHCVHREVFLPAQSDYHHTSEIRSVARREQTRRHDREEKRGAHGRDAASDGRTAPRTVQTRVDPHASSRRQKGNRERAQQLRSAAILCRGWRADERCYLGGAAMVTEQR